jgi:single-strand DNA-binding protein
MPPLMRLCVLALFGLPALLAADDAQLALLLKAQIDFDRVELPASPTLRDAAACVQSQAAVLPVTAPEELALVHFRKGYCTLAGAALTQDKGGYLAAADEFGKAIASWPLRFNKGGKKGPAEPVSSGLQMLAAISRLHAGSGGLAPVETAEITAAAQSAVCNSSVMQTDVCRQVVEIGRLWLGWMALRVNDLQQAGNYFADSAATGWPAWVAGRKAFERRAYPDAVARYTEAITIWKSRWPTPGNPAFLTGLGPQPDLTAALTESGGAQMLSGDTKLALATLDAAIKADAAFKAGPAGARPFFLRGRAHELAGQMDDALADYNLASRTAFANARDQVSGEAHLYRGIVLYRRRDFPRAENEFASALNFEIPADLRPDAVAWRHLAAVAGGSCATARQNLEQSLATVSPYFPADEARSIAAGCAKVQGKMAKSINKVILIGRLGKDAETKFTPGGASISKFTLATNRSTKDTQSGEWKELTDWHNIAVWRTEHVANFLLKGKQIYLEGRLETRSYEDKERQKKYFTEVVCDAQNVMLLGGGAGGRGEGPTEGSGEYDRPVSMPRSAQRQPSEAPAAPAEDFSQGITDDDVPF